ncbi:plasmid mobilization protein MobA [Bordetella pseudohinzii]|uniref:Conjugal transfer relaxosome component TraJ n=1 Tax=Bordetella pseudohinzii TaxID=1331258 RepID=A0A0J6BQJ4_9BORD|nr:plasmid mobilization protein MobA [Bordetella pseudohinzii]ANY18494.1 mobilization protein [Bordetella pseudohinzii]KMM24104.1 mobilization protein [Bordetella pseudohinzii]KXA77828.1 mobilization protein [Bordetella pseudohinzii]KXA78024.1 mobilization protein [Bordetella pseudohinzii]CUJ12980.1 conjugal transfer relaxosome component TraJ [Bordetella pseudohinzii]
MTARSGSESRQKTRRILIRASPEEHDALLEKARDCGVSLPAYLRACGLGRQTRSKMEAHVLNELRRLGGLQKHLFNEGNGIGSKEYSEVLIELKAAIRQAGALYS